MSNAEFAVPGPGLESLGNKSLSGFFFLVEHLLCTQPVKVKP